MSMSAMIDVAEWELDDQPIDQEQPEIPEAFYTHFQNCAVILAQHWLDVFFAKRQWHCGGSIPQAVLHSPQVVSMVLNTTQIEGIDSTYELLGKHCLERTDFPEVSNHMVYVLGVLHQCSDMRVPPCFRGGILLAVLKFCQGIPLHGC